MNYEKALMEVYKKFVKDDIIGRFAQLKPMIQKINAKSSNQLSLMNGVTESSVVQLHQESSVVHSLNKKESNGSTDCMLNEEREKKLLDWHKGFDEVDWLAEIDVLEDLVVSTVSVGNT